MVARGGDEKEKENMMVCGRLEWRFFVVPVCGRFLKVADFYFWQGRGRRGKRKGVTMLLCDGQEEEEN